MNRSTEFFLSKLCKNLSICTEEPRTGSFLKQRISLAVLLAAEVGLSVSSARLLALPAFLASAVGAKNALSKIFALKHVNVIYDDALKRWFELGKIEMAPEKEIQKHWTEPIFDSEIADMILRHEPTDEKDSTRSKIDVAPNG